jgi:soluble lytic murein transglycosylase-like protein
VQLSKLAILLGIIVSFGGSALAQEVSPPAGKPAVAEAASAVSPAPIATPAVAKVNPSPPSTESKAAAPNVSVVDSYKNSLNSLSALYQTEVQKLEKQNEQMKGLFKDGLVSRVELEANDKALADARAKVEDVAHQIAEANKPVATVMLTEPSEIAGNQSWSTGSVQIDNLIRFYGKQHGVDPYLVFCLMSQESKFTKSAVSPKGAQGLMQLMPGTAARYGVTNPYDVAQNISGGTRYLKDLLKMFNGRVDLALAGYNAGEGAVIKYGYSVPPYDETRNYVKLIIKRYGRTTATEPKAKI